MTRKRASSPPGLEHKQFTTFVKVLDAPQGIVEMYVAGIGNIDDGNDKILPGAFDASLKVRNPKGVWAHDWSVPVSKTLAAEEVKSGDARLPAKLNAAGAGGLYIKTQFNLETQRGREAFSDIEFYGDEQEYSIGYVVPKGGAELDEKTGVRQLKTLDLYEYSPVLFGMNELTQTASVKDRKYGLGVEPVEGSYEDAQEDLQEALESVEGSAYWICIVATMSDSVTYMLSSRWDGPQDQDGETYRRTYTYDEATDTITLGDRESVDVVMQVVADTDAGKTARPVLVKAWDGSASRFTDSEWKSACAACRGNADATVKDDCFLPHHDPGVSAPNETGLGSAAGRWNQTVAPDAKKQSAKAHLVAHYNTLGKDVPPALGGSGGKQARTATWKDGRWVADDECATCGKTHDGLPGKVTDAEAALAALAIIDAAAPLLRTKEGRVLAKRNEDRIRSAHDSLVTVLAELDKQDAPAAEKTLTQSEIMRYQSLRSKVRV